MGRARSAVVHTSFCPSRLLVADAKAPGSVLSSSRPPAALLHLSIPAPTRIQQGIDRLAIGAFPQPQPTPLNGRRSGTPIPTPSRRTAADPVKPIRFVFGGSRGGRRGPINRSGEMRQQRGGVGVGAGRRGDDPGLLTRAVDRVFRFVRLAEFEIFFVLFFLIAFFLFKNLMSRPEYNQLFVKKPDLDDPWP
ncbi:uncharacterized protein LOC8060960 [Sorghum bicolor]|nr:uncharacterized protein LOC8060960 [Sorghum bicolor]|eukprot:XP_002444708.2 uncharacterized protein LOC8060960 [Sorghum bicolor]